MKTNTKSLNISVIFLLGLILSSCKNDLPVTEKTPVDLPQGLSSYLDLVEEKGFDRNSVELFNDYMIVEDDILIYYDDLEVKTDNLKQARVKDIVTKNLLAINVKIDKSMSGWEYEIREAIGRWNDIKANLRFQISSNNPQITIYSDAVESSPYELGPNYCATASWPTKGYAGETIYVNLDNNTVIFSTVEQKIYLIAHELGHCIGLRHTNWNSEGEGKAIQIDRTPKTDANSIMNAKECGSTKRPSDYDRVALCQLYPNGITCAGKSNDLDKYRNPYGYCLTLNSEPHQVVANAITKKTDKYYAYTNRNGGAGKYLASYGGTDCLDRDKAFYYTLPKGRYPSSIIGMDFNKDDKLYTWYSDGKYTVGIDSDLDYYQGAKSFSVASGKKIADVRGIGITSYNQVLVWYKDGTCSRGTASDFDKNKAPYKFTNAPGKTPDDIVGMGISNYDHNFVWYK